MNIELEQGHEYVDYIRYNTYTIKIPNLENLHVQRESVLNFQGKLFHELELYYYDYIHKQNPIIRIERTDEQYIYNVKFLTNKRTINPAILYTLISTFPFKFIGTKRKRPSEDLEEATNKKMLLD